MINKQKWIGIVALMGVVSFTACGGGSGSSGNTALPLLGIAELIETNTNPVLDLSSAVDANGNALAVWRQSDGTSFKIWSNRYSVSSATWGSATIIGSVAADAYSPHVAFDASGNALAAWYQKVGSSYSVWANRFTLSSLSWGTAVSLGTGSSSPKISFDTNGDAFAVWDSGGIQASRYTTSSSSWSAAATIVSGSAKFSQIAFLPSGNALAVWCQPDGSRDAIWTKTYSSNTSTWGTASVIDSGMGNANTSSVHNENPKIAVNASGDGVVVWYLTDGTIWANRYNSGTSSWGTAANIDAASGSSTAPQVGIDASGNALAVWYHAYGPLNARHIVTQANRYNVSTSSWGVPESIGPMEGVAYDPHVAMNGNGNAWVVWTQHGGMSFSTSNIMARSYNTSTSAWGASSLVETAPGYPTAAQVVMNASGNAFAFWEKSDTNQNAWANRIQ